MPRILFRVAMLVLVVGVTPVMAQQYGNLPPTFQPSAAYRRPCVERKTHLS